MNVNLIIGTAIDAPLSPPVNNTNINLSYSYSGALGSRNGSTTIEAGFPSYASASSATPKSLPSGGSSSSFLL